MYDNELLDGILIDIDDSYAFISAHSTGFDEVADQLETEGVECFDMQGCEIDYNQPPHNWVIHSIGKLIVREAEDILEANT